ncbi:MAG TPA: hypothetical protein VM925_10240, partial [Labilithrix sp.]|nr:hypothetical protein [Labilithrix sp.]
FYAEALDDGSMLVHTFQPYAAFEASPAAGREWLSQFGEALSDVHDDPRGLLFFPDFIEPEGRTYDAVVAEVEGEGIWIPTLASDDALPDEDVLASLGLPAGAVPPGIDIAQLQQLAGQLLGDGGKPATSFDIGRLLEGMQAQLLEALETHAEEPPRLDDESASHPRPPGPAAKK